MGKGKGGITDWAVPTKIGSMPFMLQGAKNKLVKTKLSDVLKKLPICSKIVESKHYYRQANKITTYFISDKLTKYTAIEKRFLN
jgi:ribosomal protein L16/L10AE